MNRTKNGKSKIKVFILISIMGLLVSTGCTNVKESPPKETTPITTLSNAPDVPASTTTTTSLAPLKPEVPGYTGYMEPKEGQWVQYELHTDAGDMKQRITYLGQEKVSGMEASGYEVVTESNETASIMQIWLGEDMKVVKYATLEEGNVICKNASGNLQGLYAMGASGTPKEFDPAANPALEEYVTPTGKQIKAARYAASDAETWVSSDVPYGLVKAVNKESGKTVLSLYDYGLSEGQRTISAEELAGCKKMEDVFKEANDLSG